MKSPLTLIRETLQVIWGWLTGPFAWLLLPKNRRNTWWVLFIVCFRLGILGALAAFLVVSAVLWHFSNQVPDFRSLADYTPSQITRVYAQDGSLLAEYARERRMYVPYKDIPKPVIQAFLAAEDAKFFEHGGYNLKAIVRAALTNILTNRKQGASTITQQVAKTFLLSSERTYTRKIKEVILARRIERAFSKAEILELYLNQIYLGNGTYGIAAASMGYFGKPLVELTTKQRAMLAGLPKAPSAYNPLRHPRVARRRVDFILRRMEAEGFISKQEADKLVAQDLELNPTRLNAGQSAPHFTEHVRRWVEEKYGEEGLYHGGYAVMTTLDIALQNTAEKAVQRGLREYTRRHGYRGRLGKLGLEINWQKRLEEETKKLRDYKDFGLPAVVLHIDDKKGEANIGISTGAKKILPIELVRWARRFIDVDTKGPKVKKISDILNKGDIIFVRPFVDLPEYAEGAFHKLKERKDRDQLYSLEQIPKAQAALVALDVKSGAIRAMVGGTDPGQGFNRAVQAKRQPGSSFKPLVYALALEQGYTPASIVLDAPVVMQAGNGETWKPQNYSEKVYGPSTLRLGLEKSRNLMTIRLAQDLGIRPIIRFAQKFGIKSPMEANFATALGSASVSVLEIVGAYSTFPNGGRFVPPFPVSHVQDAGGKNLFSHPSPCLKCRSGWATPNTDPPEVEIASTQATDPITAYQIVNMLEGVVQRGTGWRAKAAGRSVGAKTGTTNDYKDAWFVGFSPELAVGVWVGYDQPTSLGNKETGSKAAAPIWTWFMRDALKDRKPKSFNIPEGVGFVKIDSKTGLLPNRNYSQSTLLEAFRKGTEPSMRTSRPSNTGWSWGYGSIDRTDTLREGISSEEYESDWLVETPSPRGSSGRPVLEDVDVYGVY